MIKEQLKNFNILQFNLRYSTILELFLLYFFISLFSIVSI